MREVKNDIMFGKIQSRKEIKPEKSNSVVPKEDVKELNDIPWTAGSLGRSQVNSVDALQKDIEYLLSNPEMVEKADKFFDNVYKNLSKGDKSDAYVKASLLAKAYVDEFQQ